MDCEMELKKYLTIYRLKEYATLSLHNFPDLKVYRFFNRLTSIADNVSFPARTK